MGVINYFSLESEMMGDSAAGDYMRDALGSVTGTTDVATAAVSKTYRYKPYGAQRTSSGAGTAPKFLWVGTIGYRQATAHSQSYVRARHYGQEEGRWTTVDPIWPWEHAYSYSRNNPTSVTDQTGYAPNFIGSGCGSKDKGALKNVCDQFKKKGNAGIIGCMSRLGYKDPNMGKLLDCIRKRCDSNDVCVICANGFRGYPSNFPGGCKPSCYPGGVTGGTPVRFPNNWIPINPRGTGCHIVPKDFPCEKTLRGLYPKCKAIIIICTSSGFAGPKQEEEGLTLLHELAHACTGLGHDREQVKDFITALECCICQSMFSPALCNATGSCTWGKKKKLGKGK